ncbi:MAG TPA: 8-amino-7-oxononanoate synthase [Nitrospirota bacterium]|nr:8-amino-7-oxononanoate synthase [Nitrospirota bacterium]
MNVDNELLHELKELRDSHLHRTLRKVESEQCPRIVIDGRPCINLCSNNYLGLSNHPSLKEASINAVKKYGTGAGASRLVSGNMEIHEMLESVTAKFKGTEDALLFNSGYMANTGMIQAIASEEDAIFSDELNHASIIDGCRLSKARVFIYRHKDAEHLRSLILQTIGKRNRAYRRRFVITDSVFSMDGDIAPLTDIVQVTDEFEGTLIVDDAHATGVLGSTGRGSFEHFGINSDSHIQMGTYSKALGSFGAYVAGTSTFKDYLINKARTFIYTTALPPSVVASSIAALSTLQKDKGLLEVLWLTTRLFRDGLMKLGFNTMNSETPIIPLYVGDTKKGLLFSQRLFEEGIYATPIRPPTVPEGSCRIRTTVTAAHSREDLEYCIEVFKSVGRELELI